MKYIKWMFGILLMALIIIVTAENIPNLKTPVIFTVDLYLYEYQTPAIPLGFIAVITFLIGVISMAACGITERFRLKKQIKTLLREGREMENELNSLRNLPEATGVIGTEQPSETE